MGPHYAARRQIRNCPNGLDDYNNVGDQMAYFYAVIEVKTAAEAVSCDEDRLHELFVELGESIPDKMHELFQDLSIHDLAAIIRLHKIIGKIIERNKLE